ncbi:Probable Co/Zn/Cd efflux system membrane fusion protein [hydrothermal vent metagenome]|uniref:Probable Co/Zn/Cd efflux system membrane fusion protein n=1 Tax=hydrothermal vent metagenome TaxID=652676 RepID=A0A3B1B689_9ZZZZ
MRYSILFILSLSLFCMAPGYASEGHAEGQLKMDPSTRQAQGIRTARVKLQALSDLVRAPGEVSINIYRSAQVTPRISAQVIKRHAVLGDKVTKGQRLVTLSSVDMADAQGALLVADREWRRVKKLGRKVVSERRYVAAQVTRQQAYARVLAYGMNKTQIIALLKQMDVSRATGAFDLFSPQAGTIIDDNFIVGELAKPGRLLFEISDESLLWVEAQLPPEDAVRIKRGVSASVSVDGKTWIKGRVIQRHHKLNETTRTQSIRIEVANVGDILHPGQFVQTVVQTGDAAPVVAVEQTAVILMQGSPTVFKVEGDELLPVPVETGSTRSGFTEIRAGLAVGDEVVIKGAFLLKSLALKSQIGDSD